MTDLVPIRFIDFERFKTLTEMPRFPENQDLCESMESIDRENSLVIFISHCWMRGHPATPGYDGRPHPDNEDHDKFKLCLSGIEEIKSNFASGMRHCYIWLDFGCLNQDTDPTAEMGGRLNQVIGFCDCLFSPVYGINTKSHYSAAYYDEYEVDAWNGQYGYVNKAWCRLEMFCASNIPVIPNTMDRINKFQYGLRNHLSKGVRPHLLYGTNEIRENMQPKFLPPLQGIFYSKMNPMKGLLTNEDHDRPKIKLLVDLLKPYIKECRVGYTGDRNGNGLEKHGYGIYTYSSGAVYEGQWANDRKHGHGVYTFADGDVYEGEFKDDHPHGHGVYTYADGDVYDGQWRDGEKHGQGVYRDINGSVREGRWEYGKMSQY